LCWFRNLKNPLAWRQQTFLCCSETPDFSWLTLQEFFDFHLSLYPGAQASELNRHLTAFGLLPMLSQKLAVLSLGQYKKIYLALGLSLPVRLLLIDEPFNALDVHAIAYLRSELQANERLARQCIIMTSHQQPDLILSGEFELAA